MKYKFIFSLAICSMVLVVIFGCGEDFPILTETLELSDLSVVQTSIGVGETTTIEASVYYSGDKTVLMYDWTADGGSIQGSGSRATYIASGGMGTYSINLVVSDGVISAGKTVEIVVGQQSVESMILDRNTHWLALANKNKLAYNVKISKVVSRKVLLHYDITQDRDEFDAFLSIEINQNVVLRETAIGGEQPSTGVRTTGDIDVSNVITGPGRYMVIFYIRPVQIVEKGWLMNEAKIVGVQGTSDPQQ